MSQPINIELIKKQIEDLKGETLSVLPEHIGFYSSAKQGFFTAKPHKQILEIIKQLNDEKNALDKSLPLLKERAKQVRLLLQAIDILRLDSIDRGEQKRAQIKEINEELVRSQLKIEIITLQNRIEENKPKCSFLGWGGNEFDLSVAKDQASLKEKQYILKVLDGEKVNSGAIVLGIGVVPTAGLVAFIVFFPALTTLTVIGITGAGIIATIGGIALLIRAIKEKNTLEVEYVNGPVNSDDKNKEKESPNSSKPFDPKHYAPGELWPAFSKRQSVSASVAEAGSAGSSSATSTSSSDPATNNPFEAENSATSLVVATDNNAVVQEQSAPPAARQPFVWPAQRKAPSPTLPNAAPSLVLGDSAGSSSATSTSSSDPATNNPFETVDSVTPPVVVADDGSTPPPADQLTPEQQYADWVKLTNSNVMQVQSDNKT
jgi:hypothetical protein